MHPPTGTHPSASARQAPGWRFTISLGCSPCVDAVTLVEKRSTQAEHMVSGSHQLTQQNDESVREYVEVVRNDSPKAADTLERLLDAAGSSAVLRATYILSLLKIEVVQNSFMPDLKSYRYMIQEYDDAHVALFEQAIESCLRAWGVSDVVVSLKNGNAAHRIDPPGE